MYYTHLAFGFLLAFLSLKFFSIENLLLFFTGIFIGSLFVDIDNFKSKIGRKTLGISLMLQFVFGHRGIFHTLIFSFLLFAVLYFLNLSFAYGFFIGYFSHLVIDSFNIQGVRLFYPFNKYNFRCFVRVNSFTEKLIFIALILVDGYLYIF